MGVPILALLVTGVALMLDKKGKERLQEENAKSERPPRKMNELMALARMLLVGVIIMFIVSGLRILGCGSR